MNAKISLSLTGLLLATLTAPVLADPIEGKVSTTLNDKVLIKAGTNTYVVPADADLAYIRAFDRSRRKVKIDATVGAPVMDKDLGLLRPLSGVTILDRVPSVTRTGIVTVPQGGGVFLNSKEGNVELTRVPLPMISPLRGKKVTITGLLFDGKRPELALTGLQDAIIKKGYLTQRKEKPNGKMDYDKVADVSPDTPVTVIGLEGWNQDEKTSAHVADMDADDMLFAYVKTPDGKHGYIPAFKLGLGKVVDDALKDFKRPTRHSKAEAQQKQMELAGAEAAKTARQKAPVVIQNDGKKGILDKLDDAQKTIPAGATEQRSMDDMPQRQVKLD